MPTATHSLPPIYFRSSLPSPLMTTPIPPRERSDEQGRIAESQGAVIHLGNWPVAMVGEPDAPFDRGLSSDHLEFRGPSRGRAAVAAPRCLTSPAGPLPIPLHRRRHRMARP